MQTAACARLLGLDLNQIKMALGIATNLASGLRCNNGTMAKHLLSGHVASNGITAVILALDGFNSNQYAIEDQFGFFENFSRGDLSLLKKAVDSLGDPLEIIKAGITHKFYPSCAASHSAIDCALHLIQNHTIQPDEIDEIKVTVNPITKLILLHPRPKTPTQAKHSLEYCTARAILDGTVGIEQFISSKIQEPRVLALMGKIKTLYKDHPGENKHDQPAEMHLHMKDGSEYSYQVKAARGTPENPLSEMLIEEKFRQCCEGVISESNIIRLKDLLLDLEAVDDVTELISTFNQI
jgi:2-methylcitrate dehydratase PrpD